MHAINFGASGSNLAKLCYVMYREAGINIWYKFWWTRTCTLKIY